jgi:hypothetical protein
MIFKNSGIDGSDVKRRPKGFRFWLVVISLIVAGDVVCAVVALGIQNHDDQVVTRQMNRLKPS